VAQFTPSEARILESYVKGGGGLVFFLGDNVLAERYNQQLAGQEVHILPAQIHQIVSTSGDPKHFDPLEYRHPLVRAFKGRELGGLVTTPIYKYFRLSLPAGSRAKVAIGFEGGDPAVVEEPIERGRSILVATDGSFSSMDAVAKTPWTSLPVWPSYVPLVQEILNLAISSQTADRNSEVGRPLGGSVASLFVLASLASRAGTPWYAWYSAARRRFAVRESFA
jgi:hypothetical protein